MNILITIFPILLLALVILATAYTWANRPVLPGSGLALLHNVSEGTHAGVVTRLAEAAISPAHLFVKKGTGDRDAEVCDTQGEAPIGIAADEAPAAGESVAVELLGSAPSTRLVVAGGNVAVEALVITDNAGKAITLPTSGGGTAFVCGRALTAGAADDLIEIDPTLPYQVTIAD